jgi:hypothetical protein
MWNLLNTQFDHIWCFLGTVSRKLLACTTSQTNFQILSNPVLELSALKSPIILVLAQRRFARALEAMLSPIIEL